MHIGTVIREVELMPATATTAEPAEHDGEELPAAASVELEPVVAGER
jgi:hypothetical protein